MGTSIYIKRGYVEIVCVCSQEKQSQFKANFGILQAQQIGSRALSQQFRNFFMVWIAGKVILLSM